jgi:hypothetical protein
MRNIALFSGGSVTLGLGLELELRPKYNDHQWLSENGLMLPLEREKEDEEYWKNYRYSKIVSDELGLIEYNVHDHHDKQIGGNSIDTIWLINRNIKKFSELLNQVKYVFLDIGFIRWWDENLHGMDNPNNLPNTINEVIDFINNPNSDYGATFTALQWLEKLDVDTYWDETIKKYYDLKNLYPEIQFIITPWVFNGEDTLMNKKIDDELKNDIVLFDEEKSMFNFLTKNKLMVGDVAKGFNGNYRYTYKDMHPSVDGHKKIAEILIKFIHEKKR